MSRTVKAFLLFLFGASPLAAQITVRVRSETGPLQGALVRVLDPGGKVRTQQLADERGQVRFDLREGTFTVRVDGIGFATRRHEQVTVGPGKPVVLDVLLERKPLVLDELGVRAGRSGCRVDVQSGTAAAEIWNEARKNLELVVVGRHHRTTELQITRFSRTLNDRGTVTREETTRERGFFIQPFSAASAELLIGDGFVQQRGDETVYYAPDAALFLSDAFAAAYCFRPVLPPRPRRGEAPSRLVGIAFQPERLTKPAIEGTVWLDRDTGYIVSLAYTYLGVPLPPGRERDTGGKLSFGRAAHGVIIIDEWSIRMPLLTVALGEGGHSRETLRGFLEVGAQISPPAEPAPAGAVIVGRVLDPIAGGPLASVRVAIGDGPERAATDTAGRFVLRTEQAGRYALRFHHPRFELLGIAPVEHAVETRAGDTVRVAPELPSAGAVIARACAGAADTATSLVVGRFVDSSGAPRAGVPIAARWQEIDRAGPTVTVNDREARLRTDSLGIARFCSLPTARPVELRAVPAGRAWTSLYRLVPERPRLAVIDRVVVPGKD